MVFKVTGLGEVPKRMLLWWLFSKKNLQSFFQKVTKVKSIHDSVPGFEFAVVVHLLHDVRLFVTPSAAVHQASLSFTVSQSLLRFRVIESLMPSNSLILCCPLLLSPSVFPNIRASGSFPMSRLFPLGGQRIGVSALASVLPMNSQGWFPLGLTNSMSLQYQSEKDQCQGRLRTCFGSEKRRAGIELYWEAQTSQVCMWEISKLSQDLDHLSLNFMRQNGYKQNTGFSVQDANFVFFKLGLMQFSALCWMTVCCLGCSSYPESWWLPDLLKSDFILGQGTQSYS